MTSFYNIYILSPRPEIIHPHDNGMPMNARPQGRRFNPFLDPLPPVNDQNQENALFNRFDRLRL